MPGPTVRRGSTVFRGGPILTMVEGADRSLAAGAGAVVVDGDRVVATMEAAAADPLVEAGADVVDLAGRTLVPGFIDAHAHLSIAALLPRWRDVSRAATVEEVLDAVRAQAAAEPDAPWVRVAGWDDAGSGVYPTRRLLDGLGLDRPVVVADSTLHRCVVSSLALDLLGIGKGTPDPPGGEIGRKSDGEPNGHLVERAWSEAHARSMAAYTDPDRWADHVADRIARLHTEGITAIHDAACSPEAEALYRSMLAAGRLGVSVLAMPHAAALLDNDLGERIDGPVTGEGDERFRIGPAKLFADGGAAPAVDLTIGGEQLSIGLLFPDLEAQLLRLTARGFRVGVHAMGNRGVAAAIDAFTAAARRFPDADLRPRIEHAGVASPAQCRAMASLGAVAVVQPGFVAHVGAAAHGLEPSPHGYRWLPFHDLLEAGVPIAGSSDDPCAPTAPLWGAALGVSRIAGDGSVFEADQAVAFDDWLRAYTAGAALAGGQEGERGRLAPGLRADLVVLAGRGRRGVAPTVDETWVGGVRVFTASG